MTERTAFLPPALQKALPKQGNIVDFAVAADEPCWSLSDLIQMSPDSKSVNRYEVVKIMRGERIVEFRRSLGPAINFNAEEFVIPGGVQNGGRFQVLHTVGQLREIAEAFREEKPRAPQLEPDDVVDKYWKYVEGDALTKVEGESI